MTTGRQRTFMELFAGGGLARLGLGSEWRCLIANDIDVAKAAAYRANFGDDHLVVGDVRQVRADAVDGRPDLVWASSPCQDLSQAGARNGLEGGRSGALWPALELVRQLGDAGRAPRLILIENVVGLATGQDGEGLAAIAEVLASAGYSVGAMVIDAKLFLPQSRPRLFILAAASGVTIPDGLATPGPVRQWHPAWLTRAAKRCRGWVWWAPPPPPPRRLDLIDLLDDGETASWHAQEETQSLLDLMADGNALRLAAARKKGGAVVGTLTRRMRTGAGGGREQRAELRLDGVAACLRTPAGGSSQQVLLVADERGVRTRPLSLKECARIMGLPDGYRLPRKREEALRLLGDGVAVPVVRHLAASLLEPLLEVREVPAAAARPGIKGATKATTLYLLPEEHRRLKRLAVDLEVSLHDLALRGLDKVLAEHGQRPLRRYG